MQEFSPTLILSQFVSKTIVQYSCFLAQEARSCELGFRSYLLKPPSPGHRYWYRKGHSAHWSVLFANRAMGLVLRNPLEHWFVSFSDIKRSVNYSLLSPHTWGRTFIWFHIWPFHLKLKEHCNPQLPSITFRSLMVCDYSLTVITCARWGKVLIRCPHLHIPVHCNSHS